MAEPAVLAKQKLELLAVMGYGGNVPNGLLCHPDGVHMIYPLGSTIVVKNLKKGTQTFLKGHSNNVSCIRLSHDLTKLASGQVTHMGFLADAIIWDFTKAADRAAGNDTGDSSEDIIIHRCLSIRLKFRIWTFPRTISSLPPSVAKMITTCCCGPLRQGVASAEPRPPMTRSKFVRFFNNDNDKLVTGGNYNLRVWDYGKETRKLVPVDVTLGQLQRVFMSIAISDDDSVAFVGTMMGTYSRLILGPRFRNLCVLARKILSGHSMHCTRWAWSSRWDRWRGNRRLGTKAFHCMQG